jgi:hypothetical protein
MRYIVNVSGGLTSYEALKRTIERHGVESTTAVFADTRIEDSDLYRFLDDIERHLGIQIIRIADGRTVFDVWHDQGAITLRMPGSGAGTAVCSKLLKRHVVDKWLESQSGPYTLVFGMDWSEQHRMDRLVKRYGDTPCWFPLAEKPYIDKCEIMDQLTVAGIAIPGLYLDGFQHNNCGGGCVLAGQAAFAHLLKKRPDTYQLWESEEQRFRDATGKPVAILIDRRGGGPRRPMTLKDFREQIERGERYDRDDWGVCGCFSTSKQLSLLNEDS